MARFHIDFISALERIGFLLPARNLFHAALWILIEGNAEFLDQVLAALLDEVWRIFGKVLGAFGHEIAKAGQHFIAHPVGAARIPMAGLRHAAFAISGQQVRI